jgi:hypothetical protein
VDSVTELEPLRLPEPAPEPDKTEESDNTGVADENDSENNDGQLSLF